MKSVEVLCNGGAHRIEARYRSDRRVWLQAVEEFRVCVSESIKRSDPAESVCECLVWETAARAERTGTHNLG